MVERICKNILKVSKGDDGYTRRTIINRLYVVIFTSGGKEYIRCISSEIPLNDEDIAMKLREYGFSECELIQIIIL